MRQKLSALLRVALKTMKPSQQRALLQQVINQLSDSDLGTLTTYAVSYLDSREVERMLNLETGELMTEARLKALASSAGLQAKSYLHRGTRFYQISGLYKDPGDPPGKMRRVTRHVSREDKLALVSEERVKEKIDAVLADLEARRSTVGSPPRRRRRE